MSIARSGGADLVVDVSIDAVWRVVSDVTRTGEWSHECRSVAWLPGAAGPVPGARFRGRNRSGRLRWSRICEVSAVDPPREIAWRTVPTALFPDSTDWRIELLPAGSGTDVRLSYQVTFLPGWFERLLSVINPSHADRTASLAEDLRRLGDVVAAENARSVAEG